LVNGVREIFQSDHRANRTPPYLSEFDIQSQFTNIAQLIDGAPFIYMSHLLSYAEAVGDFAFPEPVQVQFEGLPLTGRQ